MRDALDLYDLPFINTAGETIPPFAIMQVGSGWTDANQRDYFNAAKPNGNGKKFLINGPLSIATTTNANDGMGTDKPGVYVRYSGSTPTAGQEWGPVASSWAITSAGTGYLIIGDVTTVGGVAVVRVANVATGTPGDVIYAQVNEASGVGSGDATFSFDNSIPIVGSTPLGSSGTAQNQYAQVYANNEWVFLFWNAASSQWLTERGGESGSQVVYFEITENKTYGDEAVLAKPVLADGTMDAGADEFYVVDEKNMYYGRAAESGADGYRGFGLRYTDDYSEGVPGFRIISMQGPAQWLIVDLDAAYSGSGTDCNVLADEPWGRPSRGEQIPPSGVVVVEDDLSVAASAAIGDKWIVAWDEAEEHYFFVLPLPVPPSKVLQWGEATSSISAATAWGTPGTGTVQFKDDAGSNDGSPVSVENWFWDSFLNKSIVCCDKEFDPPRIVSVGCTVNAE